VVIAFTEYAQLSAARHLRFDRVHVRIDRAVTMRFACTSTPSTAKHYARIRPVPPFPSVRKRHEAERFLSLHSADSSETIAMMSSSRSRIYIGEFLERTNAAFTSVSDSSVTPRSSRRCLNAFAAGQLPSTILLVDQPTSSARMIS